jgi:hypothetical protein
MNENHLNKTFSKAQIMEYAFVTFMLLFKGVVSSVFVLGRFFFQFFNKKLVIFKDYFYQFSTIFRPRHFQGRV